jgi:hypothetical protein
VAVGWNWSWSWNWNSNLSEGVLGCEIPVRESLLFPDILAVSLFGMARGILGVLLVLLHLWPTAWEGPLLHSPSSSSSQ